MDEQTGIRMPEDSNLPCKLCNRRFLRAEAHWFCSKCRRADARAECFEDCEACVAMEEIEWRKKALEVAEAKKKSYDRQNFKNKGYRKRSSMSKLKYTKARKRAGIKTAAPITTPVPIPKAEPPKPLVATPYTNRLLDFEPFLYEELNPVIPNSLVEKGFVLPKIPKHLKNKFDVTRCELVRLLASSSICYHLSKNRSQFCDENNQIFNASSDGIVSLFASLIKYKANSLGKVIFEIREALLAGVTCANSKIISQMIKGPVNPKESFFGNINLLKEAVNQDQQNVLKMKFADSMRKPSSSKEQFNDHHSDSGGSDMF